MDLILSPQQRAVIDRIRNGQGSAFVEAVAGAGKTFTLIEACKVTTGNVAFAAYNKKIAEEIKAKVARQQLGDRVRVGTFHSFGFQAWRRVHKAVKVDDRAKANRLSEQCFTMNDRELGIEPIVFKLVSLAKQRGLGLIGSYDDDKAWWGIIEHFDLSHDVEFEDSMPIVVERSKEVLRAGIELARDIIDFDDMIYMPVIRGIKMWENDWVFVDEAQDTNPSRRALARKMLKRSGRAVFVGDRHQAIYGFTGADNDAVDQIIRDFGCIQLPLTVTYRCPKTVVAAAQTIVSHITAHESAPEGKVGSGTVEELERETFHPINDAILCRLTKPLVSMAYRLIRRGVACHVEGRDIGIGLIKLVNRYKTNSMDVLLRKLETYRDREVEKLIAKGRETQALAIEDRVETVFVLAASCNTVDELRSRISELFIDSDQERKPTLTLSTVHKSKGREWKRVFVLGRELMPSPWARQAWQREQENNLIYVAYTRAQDELRLVTGVESRSLKQAA